MDSVDLREYSPRTIYEAGRQCSLSTVKAYQWQLCLMKRSMSTFLGARQLHLSVNMRDSTEQAFAGNWCWHWQMAFSNAGDIQVEPPRSSATTSGTAWELGPAYRLQRQELWVSQITPIDSETRCGWQCHGEFDDYLAAEDKAEWRMTRWVIQSKSRW